MPPVLRRLHPLAIAAIGVVLLTAGWLAGLTG